MDPFVAEVRIFAFNFAPNGWAFCDGQLLRISQNTALFSLVGTFYGGDGKSTFALPNLQGQAAMSQGQGPGLSDYSIGETIGAETVTLIDSEIPSHSHNWLANNSDSTEQNPTKGLLAGAIGGLAMYANAGAPTQMAASTVAPAGNSFAHNNMMPYLTLNFCIAMQGVFSPRS
ncbi:MAG: tail fiber protein [Planctomycetota bacterium]